MAVKTRLLGKGGARLRRFALRVREGRTQDPADLDALAVAFEQILAGADPKTALGIAGRQGQGRPEKSATQADIEEFAPVLEVRTLMTRGEKLDKYPAMERVTTARGIPEGTLERYYKKHWRAAQYFLDWEQEAGRTAVPLQRHARFLDVLESQAHLLRAPLKAHARWLEALETTLRQKRKR